MCVCVFSCKDFGYRNCQVLGFSFCQALRLPSCLWPCRLSSALPPSGFLDSLVVPVSQGALEPGFETRQWGA